MTRFDEISKLDVHTAYTYLTYKYDEMEAERIENEKRMNEIRNKNKNKPVKNHW